MFYGQGAGKLATASAVVSDIQDCVRRLGTHREVLWDPSPVQLGDAKEYPFRFLVRVKADGSAENAEKLSAFAGALGGAGRLTAPRGVTGEAAFVTKSMPEKELCEAVEKTGVELIRKFRLDW